MRDAYKLALNEYLHGGDQSMNWILDELITDGTITVDTARRISADISARYERRRK